MAASPSEMIPLGTKATDFQLLDTVSGDIKSLSELKSDKGTVIMFICNHCPYVIHVNEQLVKLAADYQPKGIAFIAISSNDAINYPQDGPAEMKKAAQRLGYPFPYLYDESQETAKAYHAVCTPDFFLFDSDLKCVYRGQLDESRPGNGKPVTGKELRAALDAVLANEAPLAIQKPSIGCSIKWK
ncbi:MAG TPA: thioredoxin family protein [Candidatus Marinimicrobia bacterium]|nr:thioredoxin family protein [Candidatus Neomarinimicrobiota bacterium]